MSITYAVYLFANPDLKDNGSSHCFVEQGAIYPVPYGVEPTTDATDVTKWFMKIFMWGFIVEMTAVAALLMFVG